MVVGILALSLLGSTVDESFEPTPAFDQPAQPFESTEPPPQAPSNAASENGAAPEAISERVPIAEPSADALAEPGVAFVSPNGYVSMTASPEWDAQGVNTVGGTDFNLFTVPEFSTIDYRSDLLVWDLRDRELTFQAIAESQAFIEGMEIESLETRTIDGEVVGVVAMVGGRGDVEEGAVLVIHKTETDYAAALLFTPVERLAEAFVRYESHLLSVRFEG